MKRVVIYGTLYMTIYSMQKTKTVLNKLEDQLVRGMIEHEELIAIATQFLSVAF